MRGLCNETSFCTPCAVVPREWSPLCREECREEISTARGRPSNAQLCAENCARETRRALSRTGMHRSVRLAEGAARCRGPAASAPAAFAATRRRVSAQTPGARRNRRTSDGSKSRRRRARRLRVVDSSDKRRATMARSPSLCGESVVPRRAQRFSVALLFFFCALLLGSFLCFVPRSWY